MSHTVLCGLFSDFLSFTNFIIKVKAPIALVNLNERSCDQATLIKMIKMKQSNILFYKVSKESPLEAFSNQGKLTFLSDVGFYAAELGDVCIWRHQSSPTGRTISTEAFLKEFNLA